MIHFIEQERIPEEVIRNSNKVMLVDFYADWCMPCQMFSPILEEIDKKYREIEVYKVNVDESKEFAITNNINSIPTVFVYKDGELKERLVGLQTYENIENTINEYK